MFGKLNKKTRIIDVLGVNFFLKSNKSILIGGAIQGKKYSTSEKNQ
jgi:hypothetical protein